MMQTLADLKGELDNKTTNNSWIIQYHTFNNV